jgi:hypothetical protein
MKYPNVRLTILNEVPFVEMHPSDSDSYRLASADLGFDTLFLKASELMEISHNELDELQSEIRTGDEFYLEFPEIPLDNDEMKLSELLNVVKEELKSGKPYGDVPMNTLNQELTHNWHLDILASLQEAAYNLIIVRTVLIASDLGIGTISLDDSRKEPKLLEKMSKDLSQIGVELVVV